jgi:hypothetical protein
MSVPKDLADRVNLPWSYWCSFHWNEVSVKTYCYNIIFKKINKVYWKSIKCKRSIMSEYISRQALHTNMQNICLIANFPNFQIKKNCYTVLDNRIHWETFFMHILKNSWKLNSMKYVLGQWSCHVVQINLL